MYSPIIPTTFFVSLSLYESDVLYRIRGSSFYFDMTLLNNRSQTQYSSIVRQSFHLPSGKTERASPRGPLTLDELTTLMILYMKPEHSLSFLSESDLFCVLFSCSGVSCLVFSEWPRFLCCISWRFEQERMDGIVCACDTRLDQFGLVSCSPSIPFPPPLNPSSLFSSGRGVALIISSTTHQHPLLRSSIPSLFPTPVSHDFPDAVLEICFVWWGLI